MSDQDHQNTDILTDNGKEFTDRLFAGRERKPSGNHEFDRLCKALDIEHRLTKPRTPQTNGMVERFNGRIADVLRTHLSTTAKRCSTRCYAMSSYTISICPNLRSGVKHLYKR